MTVELRAMRWWDITALLPIEHDLFGTDAWSESMFWSELATADTRHYLVALDADEIVGYAGLCVYSDEAFVQTLAVRADRQGEGIGGMLLSALLADAERRGAERVGLEVRAENVGAQRLYARFGFEPIARRRGYYQPSGADALVMLRSTDAVVRK